MDAADSEFVLELEMMEVKLFETDLQQCGKKRAADDGVVEEVKRAKTAGAFKIGREEAAKYWQSLIDAGRELGIRAEEMKVEVKYTSSNHLRSMKLKGNVTKTLADNEAFLAAMRAKVNMFAQTISASTMEDLKFDCTLCDKAFGSEPTAERIE